MVAYRARARHRLLLLSQVKRNLPAATRHYGFNKLKRSSGARFLRGWPSRFLYVLTSLVRSSYLLSIFREWWLLPLEKHTQKATRSGAVYLFLALRMPYQFLLIERSLYTKGQSFSRARGKALIATSI